jgi:U3 small nucleolar RNA-associated protein 11
VKKLKSNLHMIGMEPKERKHVVFVDSKAEVKAFKPEEYFGTPAELLGRSFNRPRERQMLDESIPEASGPAASKALKKAES